jgi:hypothetical protein
VEQYQHELKSLFQQRIDYIGPDNCSQSWIPASRIISLNESESLMELFSPVFIEIKQMDFAFSKFDFSFFLASEAAVKNYSSFTYVFYPYQFTNAGQRDLCGQGYFTSKHVASNSYSVSGSFAEVLQGDSAAAQAQTITDPVRWLSELDNDDITLIRDSFSNLTIDATRSVFAGTWNNLVVDPASYLKDLLGSASINPGFNASGIARQMGFVSRIISRCRELGASKDLFNVVMGGFDTHGSFTAFGNNMRQIDSALAEFEAEMRRQGVWDKVTVVVASDFARTLTRQWTRN